MKTLKFLGLFLLITQLTSCVSVRVATDYDKRRLQEYKTYAFIKQVDQAQISDLDKKRILYAIENEMTRLGYKNPIIPIC